MTSTESIGLEITSDGDELLSTAKLIDEFEGYPHPHSFRIAAISDAVAEKFDFAAQDRESLRQAALLHDIGEMVMDRDYITDNRTLTDVERTDMRRHPVIGEQEIANRGYGRGVQLLVRWHHEWWSGSGYPDGLERDSIPLAARILRLADSYAALTDARPYSVPISTAEARRYVAEWSGIEFDPRVVKALLSLQDLEELESFAGMTAG